MANGNEERPRLTSLSHGGGCACKISPADLGQVLRGLPPMLDPNLLVGYTTSDDAAVYRLTDDLEIIAPDGGAFEYRIVLP